MILKKTYGMLKPVDESTLKFLAMIDKMWEKGNQKSAFIMVEQEMKKNDHPEILLRKAELLMGESNWDEAFTLMSHLYEQYPDHPYIIYDYAVVVSQLSLKKSIQLFKSLLKHDIENAEFYYIYSGILYKDSKYKESRNMLRNSLERSGKVMLEKFDLEAAYLQLISLNLTLNDYSGYAKAVDAFIKHLTFKKTSYELQEKIALCYVEMSRYLNKKQTRPSFRKFIDFLERRHFMNHPAFKQSFESAFCALESHEFHECGQTSKFIYDFCTFVKDSNNLAGSIEKNIYRVFATIRADVMRKDILVIQEMFPNYYLSVKNELDYAVSESSRTQKSLLHQLVQQFSEIGIAISSIELLKGIVFVCNELYDQQGKTLSRKGKRRTMSLVELVLSSAD